MHDAEHRVSTNETPPLRLPPGLRYSCMRDGQCCRDHKMIAVEPAAVERIEALDWRTYSNLSPKEKSPFVFPRGKKGGRILMRRVEGTCGFQDPENFCRLHAHHGFDFKPDVCRFFPHLFTRAPDGVYVGLSFVCKSVRENRGVLVESCAEELRALLASAPERYPELTEPIRFERAVSIAWPQYVAIEGALDEILSREDHAVEICLVAGHAWLGVLRKMLLLLRARIPKEKDLEWAIAETVEHYVKQTRGERFERAFRIAERPGAANPTLKRMLLGTFLSFHDSLRPNQWRLTTIARVVAQNTRHWFRWGSVRFEAIEKSIPYGEFRPRGAGEFATPEARELLRRYYRHALFRKDLIRHTDLFWGYGYLLLTHGLTQWYAAALRLSDGEDASRALSLVELQFILGSNFNQVFLYHPAMADIIQYLFRKPNFAHSVVLG